MQARELRTYRRLAKSGEWLTASVFRDTIKRHLRAAGWTKSAAHAESWRMLFERYPEAGGISDADVLWCLRALAADPPVSELPPSSTASMLLTLARQELPHFLLYVALYLVDTKSAFAAPLAALQAALRQRAADSVREDNAA